MRETQKTKSVPMAFRLRKPDVEALRGIAVHYRVGRSEVIRLLITREWTKIQMMTEGQDENTNK